MAPTPQKALLAAAVFALLAVVGFAAMQNRSEPAIVDPEEVREELPWHAAPAEPRSPGPGANAGEREPAFDDAGSGRPHPEDARWLEVLVVDKATGTPQPDALVHWHDDTAQAFFAGGDDDAMATHALLQVVERAAGKAGWRTRTNADGKARITLGRNETDVAVTHGRLYGRLTLVDNSVPPVGGWRIELVPDHAVRVRVVDDAGAPCAGMPIDVVVLERDSREVPLVRASTPVVYTDADGLATVPHLQLACDLGLDTAPAASGDRSSRRRDDDGQHMRVWRVRALLVGSDHEGPVFDPGAPPTEPLELRLPPTGRMRVRAESMGRPIASFDAARARWAVTGGRWLHFADREQKVNADGAAMFTRVALGVHFEVSSDADGGMRGYFAGPTAKDQLVDVVLEPSSDRVVLSGRLLQPDRQPARNARILVCAVGGGASKREATETDGEGRFVVHFTGVGETAVAHKLWIDRVVEDAPPQRADLADRTLRNGNEVLGDVVLGDMPLLCAGIFTVDGKPFAGDVNLTVERFRPPQAGKGDGRWPNVEYEYYRKGTDGRFTVHGVPEPGRYRLVFHEPRVLPKAPVEFRLGAADLAIELELAAQLAASVLVPAKAPTQHLRFTLVPEEPPAQKPAAPGAGRDGENARGYEGEIDGGENGRANVRWDTLPPGSYTLRVELWTQRRELLSIAGLAAPPPATPDPRLVDIDLRQALRVVELRVLAADGKNLGEGPLFELGGVVFTMASGEAWRGENLGQDRTELLLAPGPYDLLVCANGCRPLPVRGDGDKVVARMEPWPRVLVRVTGISQLPETTWARAWLVGPQAQDGRYETSWSRGELSEHLHADSEPHGIEDGVVRLPIGDGAHTLHVRLHDAKGDVALAAPVTILPSQLETTVVVTEAALQKALAELSKGGGPR